MFVMSRFRLSSNPPGALYKAVLDAFNIVVCDPTRTPCDSFDDIDNIRRKIMLLVPELRKCYMHYDIDDIIRPDITRRKLLQILRNFLSSTGHSLVSRVHKKNGKCRRAYFVTKNGEPIAREYLVSVLSTPPSYMDME